MTRRPSLPGVASFAKKIRGGDRAALARAITYAESGRADHQAFSGALLDALVPCTGNSVRIGVTGAPGVGKSTFIQAFGLYLLGRGRKVGVLAVDPSSLVSGGSLLGDKTRMGELAGSANVFIRPSPASGKLGGVAFHTREAILLLEAAGFDAILVETVGAGQSEAEVAAMVDVVLLLLLPGAGDELQALKKGVLEMADVLVVHKAEGQNRKAAARAVRDLKSAQRIAPRKGGPERPVFMASALAGEGLEQVWEAVLQIEKKSKKSGTWEETRKRQKLSWLRDLLEQGLLAAFHADPAFQKSLKDAEAKVAKGKASPGGAARALLALHLRD